MLTASREAILPKDVLKYDWSSASTLLAADMTAEKELKLKNRTYLLLALLFLLTAVVANASDKPGLADAQKIVKEASEYYETKGKEAALAEISRPDGLFSQGSLYVFAIDFEGIVLAHGANARLIGKNVILLKDTDGKPFIEELIAVARRGSGTVEYRFTNPQTKKVEPKITYIMPMKDKSLILAAGAYK